MNTTYYVACMKTQDHWSGMTNWKWRHDFLQKNSNKEENINTLQMTTATHEIKIKAGVVYHGSKSWRSLYCVQVIHAWQELHIQGNFFYQNLYDTIVKTLITQQRLDITDTVEITSIYQFISIATFERNTKYLKDEV